MNCVKIELKLFFDDASDVELEAFIPVFHRWIQAQDWEDTLIDVADYRHVPNGPGVILVAHDAQYAIDTSDGRVGLLYSRRRETHASHQDIRSMTQRLGSVVRSALTTCQRLEAEATLLPPLRFRGNEWLLRCNDRLAAPNTAQTYEALKECLEPVLAQLYPGAPPQVERVEDPATCLSVSIKADDGPDVETLISRLTTSAD
jgi:hypothetical protein